MILKFYLGKTNVKIEILFLDYLYNNLCLIISMGYRSFKNIEVKMAKMVKLKLSLVFFLFLPFTVVSHPDGITPYWYPSSFIYGYVTGCADQVEKDQIPFTKEFWPEQVRSICGCVVDAFRHSVTYEEIIDNSTNQKMVAIASATFPICVRQESIRKGSQ